MSVINEILNAVASIVGAAFPAVPVSIRRASEQNPEFWQDLPISSGPVWLVHCNDDRETTMAWAGMKFVKYPVVLTYCTKELPGNREVDDTIEIALSTAAQLFLASRTTAGKPGLQGVPAVNTCEVRPMKPYDAPFKDPTINASRIKLTFETIEPA